MKIILINNDNIPPEKMGGVTLIFKRGKELYSVTLSSHEKQTLYNALGYDFSFGVTQIIEVED